MLSDKEVFNSLLEVAEESVVLFNSTITVPLTSMWLPRAKKLPK